MSVPDDSPAPGVPPAGEAQPRRLEVAAKGVEVLVVESRAQAAQLLADEVEGLMRARAGQGGRAVLGLATGRSPREFHAELVRRHAEQGLSFAHVTTFNLDEYWPIQPDDPGSFRQVMQGELFGQVDMDPEHAHLPDGSVSRDDVEAECAAYEQAIRDAGGLDLQVLGIGRNGHLGFNEPGSPLDGRTRLVRLEPTTRSDAAAGHRGTVPHHAITVGLATILAARRLVLLAFGSAKAKAVHAALSGPIDAQLPASVIQKHPNARVLLDANAASGWNA